MKRVVICICLLISSWCYSAPDYLSYLANSTAWSKYVPKNYDLVQKKGDAAFFWSSDADVEKIDDKKLLSREPFLVFKPNAIVEAERKTSGGLVIYKTKYTFDAFSRRLIETKSEEVAKRRSLIFLGCSFTFGTGLAEDENFPYYFSKYRPHFNVYNMGIYSAGANDILDDLRSFKRFADIPKNGGIVFYTGIYEHIQRSVCGVNCYTKSYRDWVLKKSNYQYDPENQVLVNRGSFEGSRPVAGMIFSILSKIGLIDSINVPFKLSDEQIELYVRMMSEMKKTAKDKFNADFYFTMYPGYYENWDRLKPYLKKYGIKYLDLSKMDFKTATNQRHSIILDGHPTKLSNYLFASLVHHQLPK